MEVTIRTMEPHEAPEVLKIGRRAFTGFESLWVPKPKTALVAVAGDKITGAVLYKIFTANGKKIGYIDYAFIDRDYHHQGIGGQLYRAAMDFLWDQCCDVLTAVVKDDNVGSWGLLLKNGFSRISVPELFRQFGIDGMMKHYFGTPLCIGIGMEYYVALKGEQCPSGKLGSGKQIFSYLFINLLLFLVMLVWGTENMAAFLCAYMIMLAGGILTGYVGTFFSPGRRWDFRLNNGGILVCLLVNLGVVYPMVGNWYPDKYEKTPEFKRDMGIQALCGWLFVLIMTVVAIMAGDHVLLNYLGNIGWMFLFYRMVPIFPFESFGGRRVFEWNRYVYGVMFVLSAVCFVLLI